MSIDTVFAVLAVAAMGLLFYALRPRGLDHFQAVRLPLGKRPFGSGEEGR